MFQDIKSEVTMNTLGMFFCVFISQFAETKPFQFPYSEKEVQYLMENLQSRSNTPWHGLDHDPTKTNMWGRSIH